MSNSLRNSGLDLGFFSRTTGHPYDKTLHYKGESCGHPAKIQRESEECHLCRDWGGCGGDCKVSRIYCPHCGNAHPPFKEIDELKK
jgi:hypothetical protein